MLMLVNPATTLPWNVLTRPPIWHADAESHADDVGNVKLKTEVEF